MNKKVLAFYCAAAVLLCQFFLCFAAVSALTDNQKTAISDNCGQIKTILHNIQHEDSRARVYLGGSYETIRSKFMVPLNHRLVDNGISDVKLTELVSNQAAYAAAQTNFKDDFIEYQKNLEELINVDCKNSPDDFYQKLTTVREKRHAMVQDIAKLSELIEKHLTLVTELKGNL